MTGDLVSYPRPADPEPADEAPPADGGLRRRLIAGLVVSALLVIGIGGWAAYAPLAGAVIASGLIVVDSNIKKVQHPYGGVVGKIFVKNGDPVAAGDLLIRLDDTQTRAALGIVVSQLVELTGRAARLEAERDDADAIVLPPGFEAQGPDAARVAQGERRLFQAGRQTAAGQKAQFRERIGQLGQEIEGLSSQRDAKARELKLVREELARVRDMYKQRLTPITRVLAMERDESRIDGEHGALTAQIARAKGQISETELQIIAIDRPARPRRKRSCARSRRACPSSPSARSRRKTSCAASSCARRFPASCTSSACTQWAASSAPASR
jgi:HlyD family secretion protein